MARGFEDYVVEHTTAERVNRKAIPWLAAHRRQPFFLFINYMDTHRPYNTRPRPGLLPRPAIQDQGELLDRLYQEVMPGQGPIPSELVRAVIDQYDTAIANLDEQLGVLFDALRKMGLFDDMLIVVTSDHGEYFGEHHLVEHSKDIYQEALRVPLIVKLPGQDEGVTSDVLVSSPDVTGMILDQVPIGDDPVVRRLSHYRPGAHPVIAEAYYTRPRDLFHPIWGHRFDRVRVAIFDGPHELIQSSDGAHELYDLEQDPTEGVNLVEARKDVAERMAASLARFRPDSLPAAAPRTLSEEEWERLRSLGYVGP